MKRKLLCALLTGAMVLSAGSAVMADETESETSNVNEDGSVNDPSKVEVDENKLVMWSLFTGGDGEYMTKIIDDYNATSPSKQVQSITLVWADYYTKLQTAVAADKGPDIGLSHVSKLPELVDQGVVEAAQSMGASAFQIVRKVLLPEALPSLISGGTITIATILGYGAMAGIIGGGGLGKLAINYGYYNFKFIVMWAAVIGLIILVQLFQSLGTRLANRCDKRLRKKN